MHAQPRSKRWVIWTGIVFVVGMSSATAAATDKPPYRLDVSSAGFNARGDGVTDDTAALQNAVRAASGVPGGTVFIPAGTYLFSKSLKETAGVRLLGAGRDRTVLKMTRSSVYGINLASGMRVEALTLRGNKGDSIQAHGFNGGNTTNAEIVDCIIEQWGGAGVLGGDNSGGNRIARCIIRDNGNEGVYFGEGCDQNTIADNEIYRNAKSGVDINGSANRILNNVVHDIGKAGDEVDTTGIMIGNFLPRASVGNIVAGNKVFGCATHGIILWAASRQTVVMGNTCRSNAHYGIFLQRLGERSLCEGNIVTRNIVSESGSYGIVVEAGSTNVIAGNEASRNAQDGIAIDSTNGPAEHNLISGNTCTGNRRHGLYVSAGSKGNVVLANIVTGNGESEITDRGLETVNMR